ncbi:MAG: hypothetical protein J6Q81_06955, partial [Lentisphaeria bacterium]|nr:hypothetical protein [Lentisphaeria bacterium]
GGESNPLRGCAADTILLPVKVYRTTLAFCIAQRFVLSKKPNEGLLSFFQPITTRSVVKFELKQYNTRVLQNC